MANDSSSSWADDILDELLPDELDWQAKVRAYPLAALAVAGGLGFFLGQSRGALLASAVSRFAVDRVSHNIGDVLEHRAAED